MTHSLEGQLAQCGSQTERRADVRFESVRGDPRRTTHLVPCVAQSARRSGS